MALPYSVAGMSEVIALVKVAFQYSTDAEEISNQSVILHPDQRTVHMLLQRAKAVVYCVQDHWGATSGASYAPTDYQQPASHICQGRIWTCSLLDICRRKGCKEGTGTYSVFLIPLPVCPPRVWFLQQDTVIASNVDTLLALIGVQISGCYAEELL